MYNQNTSPQPSKFIQTAFTTNKYLSLILLALTALLAATLLSILPSPQTSATTTSQQLPISINPQTIQVNSDNSFSLFNCNLSAFSNSEYAFASSHNLNNFANRLKNPVSYSDDLHIPNCFLSGLGNQYILDDNGSLYASFTVKKRGGYSDRKIGRYKNNVLDWQRGFQMCAIDRDDAFPSSLTQGYDGHIYSIVLDTCGGSDHTFISFDKDSGDTRFEHSLLSDKNYVELDARQKIRAFDDGIVLVDGTVLRYFDYLGQEDTSRRQVIPTPDNAEIRGVRVTDTGTAYITYYNNSSSPCLRHGMHSHVDIIKSDGSTSAFDIDTCNTYKHISQAKVLPSGDLAILTERRQQQHFVLIYSEDGLLKENFTIEAGNGYYYPNTGYRRGISVDENSNIFFTQEVTKNGGDKDQHVTIHKITASGQIIEVLNTKSQDLPEKQLFRAVSYGQLGLADNTVYAAICHNLCNQANPPYIYEMEVPGTGANYPNSRIGTAIPDHDVDADGDDLTKWQEVQQQTADDNTDSDGDGLNDFLESRWNPDRHDLFCSSDHSVCEYPTPHEKDVYVEVDWMTRPADGSTDSYTTKPNETQINEIKDAFDAKGIHAHFDTGQLGGGNEVPYNKVVKFGIVPNEVDFFDYKKGGDGIGAQFNQDRYKIYHYMLSGYRYDDISARNSGISLISDDDFFVAFGSLKEEFNFVLPGQEEKAITGTIIHELGHNLCLTGSTHNVPECSFAGIDANYGNDYPSAMNYDKQFELIDYSTGQNGANDHDDWGAIRLQDFVASNAGDEEHDLLQSMQTQSARSFTPMKMQPQYRELQNKLQALEKRIERHEDR